MMQALVTGSTEAFNFTGKLAELEPARVRADQS